MTKSHSVGTLSIRHPAPSALPPGTLAAFGQLQPTQVWQSVNATGGLPAQRRRSMAAMYQQRTHKTVDGVIAVDPIVLQHVLDATGRVYVAGIPGNGQRPKNVVYVLMHGLYLLYPQDYQRARRHDEVAAVASAAVDRMKRHPTATSPSSSTSSPRRPRDGTCSSGAASPSSSAPSSDSAASGSLTPRARTRSTSRSSPRSPPSSTGTCTPRRSTTSRSTERFGDAIQGRRSSSRTPRPKGCKPHYVCGPDHINSSIRGQYVGRLDLWFPHGAIPPGGGLQESGLVLARQTVRHRLPGHHETIVLEAVIAARGEARHDARCRSSPSRRSDPAAPSRSTFSAPSWSVSGPSLLAVVGDVAPRRSSGRSATEDGEQPGEAARRALELAEHLLVGLRRVDHRVAQVVDGVERGQLGAVPRARARGRARSPAVSPGTGGVVDVPRRTSSRSVKDRGQIAGALDAPSCAAGPRHREHEVRGRRVLRRERGRAGAREGRCPRTSAISTKSSGGDLALARPPSPPRRPRRPTLGPLRARG